MRICPVCTFTRRKPEYRQTNEKSPSPLMGSSLSGAPVGGDSVMNSNQLLQCCQAIKANRMIRKHRGTVLLCSLLVVSNSVFAQQEPSPLCVTVLCTFGRFLLKRPGVTGTVLLTQSPCFIFEFVNTEEPSPCVRFIFEFVNTEEPSPCVMRFHANRPLVTSVVSSRPLATLDNLTFAVAGNL